MNEIILDSFEKFISHITSYDGEHTLFRGVKHADYDLKPRMGRISLQDKADLPNEEKTSFNGSKTKQGPTHTLIPISPTNGYC